MESFQWARKMGLKRVGEVQMLRPFEDDPIYAPTSVDTEGEFESWVEKHKKPIMQKLTLQNYFNVWVKISHFWCTSLNTFESA